MIQEHEAALNWVAGYNYFKRGRKFNVWPALLLNCLVFSRFARVLKLITEQEFSFDQRFQAQAQSKTSITSMNWGAEFR